MKRKRLLDISFQTTAKREYHDVIHLLLCLSIDRKRREVCRSRLKETATNIPFGLLKLWGRCLVVCISSSTKHYFEEVSWNNLVMPTTSCLDHWNKKNCKKVTGRRWRLRRKTWEEKNKETRKGNKMRRWLGWKDVMTRSLFTSLFKRIISWLTQQNPMMTGFSCSLSHNTLLVIQTCLQFLHNLTPVGKKILLWNRHCHSRQTREWWWSSRQWLVILT